MINMKKSLSINSLVQLIYAVQINIEHHEALLNNTAAVAELDEDELDEYGDTAMQLMKLASELSSTYHLERELHYPQLPSYEELISSKSQPEFDGLFVQNEARAISICTTTDAAFSLRLNIELHKELFTQKNDINVAKSLTTLKATDQELSAIYEAERQKSDEGITPYAELCKKFVFI